MKKGRFVNAVKTTSIFMGLWLPIWMLLNMALSAELGSKLQPSMFNDQDDRVGVHERKLAELRYETGMRVVFSYDETSRDYGLLQEGVIGESEPLVIGPVESLLAVYLDITPEDMPVPEQLLLEPPSGLDLSRELNTRAISSTPVAATQLMLPIVAPVAKAGQSCYSTYYAWWDWHDPATAGMAPKTYGSSSFGGKKRYADSYVLNCVPAGSPSWLWARHRIDYKKANGKYKNHFEGKVAPWHWQAKHKGSIKRYRRVRYDDNWNSSPNCLSGGCKYTREGRFHN